MADTTTGTSSAALTPSLTIENGQVTTSSLQIAEHFAKAHRSVLLAIRRLECSQEFRLHNFVQSSYINEQGKKQPCYRITRDGFVFLAMGFTGKEAAQWKEAYITEFNRMEQELRGNTGTASLSASQKQHLHELVDIIAAAGMQSHAETWSRLHRKFSVNSYHELRQDQFDSASHYLRGKMDGAGLAVIAKKHFPQLEAPSQFSLDEVQILRSIATKAQSGAETIDTTVQRWARQLSEGNAQPVDTFLPLWHAINARLAQRVAYRQAQTPALPLKATHG